MEDKYCIVNIHVIRGKVQFKTY